MELIQNPMFMAAVKVANNGSKVPGQLQDLSEIISTASQVPQIAAFLDLPCSLKVAEEDVVKINNLVDSMQQLTADAASLYEKIATEGGLQPEDAKAVSKTLIKLIGIINGLRIWLQALCSTINILRAMRDMAVAIQDLRSKVKLIRNWNTYTNLDFANGGRISCPSRATKSSANFHESLKVAGSEALSASLKLLAFFGALRFTTSYSNVIKRF